MGVSTRVAFQQLPMDATFIAWTYTFLLFFSVSRERGVPGIWTLDRLDRKFDWVKGMAFGPSSCHVTSDSRVRRVIANKSSGEVGWPERIDWMPPYPGQHMFRRPCCSRSTHSQAGVRTSTFKINSESIGIKIQHDLKSNDKTGSIASWC